VPLRFAGRLSIISPPARGARIRLRSSYLLMSAASILRNGRYCGARLPLQQRLQTEVFGVIETALRAHYANGP